MNATINSHFAKHIGNIADASVEVSDGQVKFFFKSEVPFYVTPLQKYHEGMMASFKDAIKQYSVRSTHLSLYCNGKSAAQLPQLFLVQEGDSWFVRDNNTEREFSITATQTGYFLAYENVGKQIVCDVFACPDFLKMLFEWVSGGELSFQNVKIVKMSHLGCEIHQN